MKNADTSTAMLTDKMANVLSTHAEVCTAGDASCLMHIGGGLSRLRSGTRTVHLAEILASTEEAVTPPAVDQAGGARMTSDLDGLSRKSGLTTVFLGIPTAPRGVGHLRGDRSFPDAARDALRDGQLRANLGHATDDHPRQARRASSARCPTGRSCARPAGRSRPPRWPASTST